MERVFDLLTSVLIKTFRILTEASGKSFFSQKYRYPSQIVANTFFQFFYLKKTNDLLEDFVIISALLVLLFNTENRLIKDL